MSVTLCHYIASVNQALLLSSIIFLLLYATPSLERGSQSTQITTAKLMIRYNTKPELNIFSRSVDGMNCSTPVIVISSADILPGTW